MPKPLGERIPYRLYNAIRPLSVGSTVFSTSAAIAYVAGHEGPGSVLLGVGALLALAAIIAFGAWAAAVKL